MKQITIFIFLICFSQYTLGLTNKKDILHNYNPKSLNVLFIGNSLTYTNNLPELVSKIALGKNVTLKTTTVANPNYALIDHWNDGEIQKLISENTYDFVIVQQGPSSQPEGRKMLLNDGAKIKELCEINNAKLVYFMVWPSKQYYYTFDDVIKNHIEAATKNDALLAPVGAVWKVHFDKTGDYSFYGNDGFHPSLKGSKKAAEVIVATILN
ncbi:SGNH/GDSL hydrolase family protein [uncultured Croceitalea sp.]|uniref:SGNH/GDSL hydrolase family protein n=1 Tax=uncultured Croceitalea sp. TaxID=1798908 RepID=UPI00374EDF4B